MYGITKISNQSERDLDPDIWEFESEGMSRNAAIAFNLGFNKDRVSDKPDTERIDTIPLNGQTMKLNFDTAEIHRLMVEGVNAALPYGLLLKKGLNLSISLKPLVLRMSEETDMACKPLAAPDEGK